MTEQHSTAPAADANPLSDEYVNAVIQRHGYQSPETVIARLNQWIGLHGGEDSVTLLMYEAHKALSKLRAPVASAEVMDALNWVDDFIARCNRDDRGSCDSVNVLRRALASAPVAGEAQPYGWLYDWTHRSATGRPDEHYTSFTKEEAHAKKHDNPRAVYLAAPQTGTYVAGGEVGALGGANRPETRTSIDSDGGALASVAGQARPAAWQDALRIAELPEVDGALANFCDDSSKENAVALVLAVLGAAPQASEAVLQAARQVLSYTESAHRPPVRESFPTGATARVRIHALADLHDAVNAALSAQPGAQKESRDA